MGPGRIEEERIGDGLAVVEVHGEHDLNTAPDLRDRLDAAVADGLGVVVDLSPASERLPVLEDRDQAIEMARSGAAR